MDPQVLWEKLKTGTIGLMEPQGIECLIIFVLFCFQSEVIGIDLQIWLYSAWPQGKTVWFQSDMDWWKTLMYLLEIFLRQIHI